MMRVEPFSVTGEFPAGVGGVEAPEAKILFFIVCLYPSLGKKEMRTISVQEGWNDVSECVNA